MTQICMPLVLLLSIPCSTKIYSMNNSHLPDQHQETKISDIVWPFQIASRVSRQEDKIDSPSSLHILPRSNASEEIQPILGEILHYKQPQSITIITRALSDLIAHGYREVVMPENTYNKLLQICLDNTDASTLFILNLPYKKDDKVVTLTLPNKIPEMITQNRNASPEYEEKYCENTFEDLTGLRRSVTLANLLDELEKFISHDT